MILHVSTHIRPDASIPWYGNAKNREIQAEFIKQGKLVDVQTEHPDELTIISKMVFIDQAAYDEYQQNPDIIATREPRKLWYDTHGITNTVTVTEI